MRSLHSGLLCLALLASACCEVGVSTHEIEQAAVDRARSQLGVGKDQPMEATVWIGEERDGQISYCGSVRAREKLNMRPQRFLAHVDPIEFVIFENAHDPDFRSQPGMFENWTAVCGDERAS